jgi:NADH-quinone oxidoreductase subunit A
MVAILFVIFDVEVIFMYPWAVNFREMGVDGLWKMGIFLAVLVAGLVYEVKRKALDWD